MSDMIDGFRWQKGQRKARGECLRTCAISDFGEACAYSADHDMMLYRRTEVHYQLRHLTNGWILDIYPGNQRLYRPNRKPRAPFLTLKLDDDVETWTLMDVVKAAAQHNGLGKRKDGEE